MTDFLAVVYFSYIREDETRDSSYCLSAKSKKKTQDQEYRRIHKGMKLKQTEVCLCSEAKCMGYTTSMERILPYAARTRTCITISLSLSLSVSTEGMLLEGGNKGCHSQISSVTGYCTTAEALTHHPDQRSPATHTSLQSDWTISCPKLDADRQIIYTTAMKHLKHTNAHIPSLPPLFLFSWVY